MMTTSNGNCARILFLIGRSGLALLFVLGGILKAIEPSIYLDMMRKAELTPAVPLLVIVAALELLAGLTILFGHRFSAAVALVLAIHTLLINTFIHRFWELEEPFRSLTIGLFTKNITIAAALLLYAGASLLVTRQKYLS